MFLFIYGMHWLRLLLMSGLNTSHVLIYLNEHGGITGGQTGFKYISCSYLSGKMEESTHQDSAFKYISCSYLSKSLFLSSFVGQCLNTSHVLIYLTCIHLLHISIQQFKYISCSYLSHVFKPFFNSIYPFFPLNSSISQNFTNRLSFFG